MKKYKGFIPPCGIYCGGCPHYIREKNTCLGAEEHCKKRKCVILLFNQKYVPWLKVIMFFSQILLIGIAVMMSFNTINKIFDIAKYISGTAYYNALVLLTIPLIVKLMKNES